MKANSSNVLGRRGEKGGREEREGGKKERNGGMEERKFSKKYSG